MTEGQPYLHFTCCATDLNIMFCTEGQLNAMGMQRNTYTRYVGQHMFWQH